MLACSVRDQLRPALIYLRRLGFRDTRAIALQDPIFLVSSVERMLAPKLGFRLLEEEGEEGVVAWSFTDDDLEEDGGRALLLHERREGWHDAGGGRGAGGQRGTCGGGAARKDDATQLLVERWRRMGVRGEGGGGEIRIEEDEGGGDKVRRVGPMCRWVVRES